MNAYEANFCQISSGDIQRLVIKTLCGGSLDELNITNKHEKTASICVKIIRLWDLLSDFEIETLYKLLKVSSINYPSTFALFYVKLKEKNNVTIFESTIDDWYKIFFG